MDYQTGAVYHLPEGPAASEAVPPLAADGKMDQVVLSRLSVRHDDSQGNVARRLQLWDMQVGRQGHSSDSQLRHDPF